MSGASFPSSYIKTTSSAVSRAADDLSFPISFGPQELTVYGKIMARGVELLASRRVFQLGDGTILGDPRLYLESKTDDSGALEAWSSTADGFGNVEVPDGTITFGDVVEYRLVWESDGTLTLGWSINGGAESSVTDGTSPTPSGDWSTVGVGTTGNGSNPGPADHISGPIIAPGVRTMDECRALAGTA